MIVNGRDRMGVTFPEPYRGVAAQAFARCQAGGPVTHARDVADAVWRAAADPACPMRLPAGADAVARAAAV